MKNSEEIIENVKKNTCLITSAEIPLGECAKLLIFKVF